MDEIALGVVVTPRNWEPRESHSLLLSFTRLISLFPMQAKSIRYDVNTVISPPSFSFGATRPPSLSICVHQRNWRLQRNSLCCIDAGCLKRVVGSVMREVQRPTKSSMLQCLLPLAANAELISELEFDQSLRL